jgi:hypothetical protein
MRPTSAAVLGLLALAALLPGCGGSDHSGTSAAVNPADQTPARDAIRVPPLKARVITVEHLRRAILQGVGRDYLGGTQVGPPSYGLCLQRGVRRLLDGKTLRTLALVYRQPSGQQRTAQALTEIAAPVGARCAGGRKLVPMMIEASMAFRAGHLPPVGIGARLSYGPYLGVTCRRASSIRCDRVGIDLVLRRRASAVVATIAGRALRLRTPGLHTGAAGKDWVGYLDGAGLRRRGSRFQIDSYGEGRSWAGSPPVYLPVRIEIVYRGGQRAAGTLPRVSLSPGWG